MMQLVLSDGGSVVTPGGNGGNSNGRPSVVDKFCYFVRQGEVVYTSITSDASLLYGEICGNPLESVRALLSSAYGELFAVSREWGKAKQDKREELTNEVDRFVAGLTAALDSMEGGLVLRRPTMEQLEICRIEESSGGTSVATRPTATSGLVMGGVGAPAISTSAANQRANQSPEIVVGLEQLLDEWCSDMESYMEKKVATVVPATAGSRGLSFRGGGGGGVGGDDPSSEAAVDVGPRGELTYWRGRMQRLQSVHEQLTQPQCKRIVDFMAALSRGSVVAAATAAAAAALNGNGNASLSSLTATSSTLPGSSAIVIDKVKIAGLVQRWKRIDVAVTEAANEAKDNVKYLFSLRKSFEPLYSGTAQNIMDSLPTLLNSIKMIHTIARYYNSTERMTTLFCRITDQMIANCSHRISRGGSNDELWDRDITELVRELRQCLNLEECYKEHYHTTMAQLAESNPGGKQFDFNEMQIFGKFELFCRRVNKLIGMFTTIDHFNTLANRRLEGMESLIDHFYQIQQEFRDREHDLLDYHNNRFDRDYVEFNVRIDELEKLLQRFIDQSFETIGSIGHSLELLHTFRSILHRDNLRADLNSKLALILQNYGLELEQVQQLYEKQKHDPPIPRNSPPVAGNIAWSRHLLKRIEEPMKQFEADDTTGTLLSTKDARRIIKMYNKVARTLVAFEFLWYKAWVQSIDQAKTGLQATVVIRHPDDDKLYVNFDQDILQLIREAKSLERMGLDVPENAKIVLYQEQRFKTFSRQLQWALSEYDRIAAAVIPAMSVILRPHFTDMEYKLRPGMVALTWTSMNIDSFITHVQSGLRRLDELVSNVNDVVENRIEKNLKVVSKCLLVDLPDNSSFTVSDFVDMQRQHIAVKSTMLQEKNAEIEHAVDDLIEKISSYQFESPYERVLDCDVIKLKDHYNHFIYQALLNSSKNSLNALKKRMVSKGGASSILNSSKPFFEVDVQLVPPSGCSLSPSLDEIQECISRSACAMLGCYRSVLDWDQECGPGDGGADGAGNAAVAVVAAETTTTASTPASSSSSSPPTSLSPSSSPRNFFDRITKDIELVRVVLLLTGCIQGVRNTVAEYLSSFGEYDWLWKADKDAEYQKFAATNPTLDDYETKLRDFSRIEYEVDRVNSVHVIGALSLNTGKLKRSLADECNRWKIKYSEKLHDRAKSELERLTEYTRVTMGKLGRKVDDLDSLGFMMRLLAEVRDKESYIDMEIEPVMEMYKMLEDYLPSGFMAKEEIDKKTVLRANWKKVVVQSQVRQDELSRTQIGFRRDLVDDIAAFKVDVVQFRRDFLHNGPMVQGLAPMEAVDRLSRFKEELQIRERKFDLFRGGDTVCPPA